MPKVEADLSTVSTDTSPAPAGTYRLVVRDIEVVKLSETPRRVAYNIRSEIYAPGLDEHEKSAYLFANMHDKQGNPLKPGIAAIKRLFEAIVPDMAESAEADTDALIDGHYTAEVYIDSYRPKDAPEGAPARQSNKVNELSIRVAE